MSTDDRLDPQLGERLRAALDRPSTLTADDVVAGGRRRARRRTTTRVGAGVASALVLAGLVAGVPRLGGTDERPQPAVTSTIVRTAPGGCTLDVARCDPDLLRRWATSRGLTTFSSTYDADARLDKGVYALWPRTGLYTVTATAPGRTDLTVELTVSPVDELAPLWAMLGETPVTVDARAVTVLPGVEARAGRLRTPRGAVDTWMVPVGPGHGSLVLQVTSGSLDDGEATEILRAALTAAPTGTAPASPTPQEARAAATASAQAYAVVLAQVGTNPALAYLADREPPKRPETTLYSLSAQVTRGYWRRVADVVADGPARDLLLRRADTTHEDPATVAGVSTADVGEVVVDGDTATAPVEVKTWRIEGGQLQRSSLFVDATLRRSGDHWTVVDVVVGRGGFVARGGTPLR